MTDLTRSRLWSLALVMNLVAATEICSQNITGDMDHDARHVYDRMIIMTNGGHPMLHSSIFPYMRLDLTTLANLFDTVHISNIDKHQVQNIRDQNNEFIYPSDPDKNKSITFTDTTKTFFYISDSTTSTYYRKSKRPLWNTFYRTPAFLYEVDTKDFYLRVNPVIHLGGGRETQEDVTTFINQRGISLRGGVGQNVYFSTTLYDSQMRYVNYINRFTEDFGVVPGAGFYKNYKSAFLKFTEGRDFLLANAYVGIDLGKYIGFQLGHNQHFIGDGIRSLFLSDFSTPFFSLKINTRIWRLHYQNIFAELAADNFEAAVNFNAVPKKYMAAHYLSFKPRNNITIGLFETVIFNRPDHRFELQYLNPVILYRTVEGSIGSPDNVMLGLNARWDIRKSLSFYGQFLLDDILIREILNGHLDWWGNKFGHQLGVKYINALGIDQLDLQAEWNQVRPYTYSHYDENANYSHYKQALAHPLGANFNEFILGMHYMISSRLGVQSSIYVMRKGEDTDSISYGGDIIVPNAQRPGDYGHEVGQGIHTNILYWSATAKYELSSGLYLDLKYLYRKKSSDAVDRNLTTNLFQLAVRLNMPGREDVF